MKSITAWLLSALLTLQPTLLLAQSDDSPPEPSIPTNQKSASEAEALQQETRDLFSSLDYPELQVVPRASQRLRREGEYEKERWWAAYWPMQVSAFTTLYASTNAPSSFHDDVEGQRKADARSIARVAQIIGGSWLVGSVILGVSRPHLKGYKAIQDIPEDTKANRLLRERLAEEHMQSAAELSRKLKYISTATNFVASVALMSDQNSKGKAIAGFSAIVSFLPLFFKNRYESTYEKHQEYKRKIYSPVVYYDHYMPSEESRPTGRINLVWNFQ